MYELRENYYALYIATLKQMQPERAFMMMEGEVGTPQDKYGKEELIALYYELEEHLGRKPMQPDWELSELTPSRMPIRKAFGTWKEFQKICLGRQHNGYFGRAEASAQE